MTSDERLESGNVIYSKRQKRFYLKVQSDLN